jgi:hypothetical protein
MEVPARLPNHDTTHTLRWAVEGRGRGQGLRCRAAAYCEQTPASSIALHPLRAPAPPPHSLPPPHKPEARPDGDAALPPGRRHVGAQAGEQLAAADLRARGDAGWWGRE